MSFINFSCVIFLAQNVKIYQGHILIINLVKKIIFEILLHVVDITHDEIINVADSILTNVSANLTVTASTAFHNKK